MIEQHAVDKGGHETHYSANQQVNEVKDFGFGVACPVECLL